MASLLVVPARAARPVDPPVSIDAIFAAYEHATHAGEFTNIEAHGTVMGEGLSGTFHSWRDGASERQEEHLGPRSETTLRLGDRIWIRNTNGNVRELHGYLRRSALTADFVDSGAFLRDPARARFVGYGAVNGKRAWRVEVNAAGGEPETLWISTTDGLLLRTELLDGDGPAYVDYSDWRDVGGQRVAFHAVSTDGNHAFDLTEQTTDVQLGGAIDPAIFAPLVTRRISAGTVQTVPLVHVGSHVGCTVTVNGTALVFLLDTGAQSVLVDTRVAKKLGLEQSGALEVRGALRTGGLHVARVSSLGIGNATLDDLVVSTIDLQPAIGGAPIDGILGYPFFASALVQLDFANEVMRFGPPGSFEPPGERIELDVDREIPEAMVRVNGSVDAPFIIDSGNSGDVLLYRPFVDAHPGIVPVNGGRSVNYGLGGANSMYRTHLDELRFGNLVLTKPNVNVVLASNGAFADRVDAGNIGLTVLHDYLVTFDIPNGAMYFLPRSGPKR